MKRFDYTIRDRLGIHARPAGMIVSTAKRFAASITVSKGEVAVDARRLFALMGLSAKEGDTITVTCQGEDEVAAAEAMQALLAEKL